MSEKISISISLTEFFGITDLINSNRLIKRIEIFNDSGEDLLDYELEINSRNGLFDKIVLPVDEIPSGQAFVRSDIALICNYTKFASLTAAVNSSIYAVLYKNKKAVLHIEDSFTAIPYNYFPGAKKFPELLAKFVTPDQHEVQEIVTAIKSSLSLNKLYLNKVPYDKVSRKTVEKVISVIYQILKAREISFDSKKIPLLNERLIALPENVLNNAKGDSLEISLLCASIFEAIGLYPILAVFENNVAVGVMLEDAFFSDAVFDNFDAIKDSDVILWFDPRSLVVGTNVSFDQAKRSAADILNSSFIHAIDIKRLREAGIKQIPSRKYESGLISFETNDVSENEDIFDTGSVLNDLTGDRNELLSRSFQRLMVDVSNASSLINIDKSRCLKLVSPGFAPLINELTSAGSVKIAPFPVVDEAGWYSGASENELEYSASNAYSTSGGTLFSMHKERDMFERLTKIYNDARFSKEAYGVQDLYISYGVLNWIDPEYDKPIASPLILIPVEFSGNGTFAKEYIRYSGNNILINRALIEKIRKIYHFNMPSLEKLFENVTKNIDKILLAILDAANENRNLSIAKSVYLGYFDTRGFSVLNEISGDNIKKSPFLRAISGEKEDFIAQQKNAFSPTSIPLSDAQKKALRIYNNSSVSLINGASRTGKTTVLTEILLQALFEGKRVLFSAASVEKANDLYRFLKELELSPFTLRLFGENNRIEAFPGVKSNDCEADTISSELIDEAISINSYYNSIQTVESVGLSFIEATEKYEEFKDAKYFINIPKDFVKNLTKDSINEYLLDVKAISEAAKEAGEAHGNPLRYIEREDFSYELKEEYIVSLSSFLKAIEELKSLQQKYASIVAPGIEISNEKSTEALISLIDLIIKFSSDINPVFFNGATKEEYLHLVEEINKKYTDTAVKYNQIRGKFKEEVFSLPLTEMQEELKRAEIKGRFKYKSQLSNIYGILKENAVTALSKKEIPSILSELIEIYSAKSFIDDNKTAIDKILGENFDISDSSHYESLLKKKDISIHFYSLLSIVYSSAPEKLSLAVSDPLFMPKLNEQKNMLLDSETSLSKTYTEYRDIKNNCYGLITNLGVGRNTSELLYDLLYQTVKTMLENMDSLKSWCEWLKIRNEKYPILGFLIDAYEFQNIPSEDLYSSYCKSLYKAICDFIFTIEKRLGTYSLSGLNDSIRRLDVISTVYRNTRVKEIAAKITENIILSKDNITADEFKLITSDSLLNRDGALDLSPIAIETRFPITICCRNSAFDFYKGQYDLLIVDDAQEHRMALSAPLFACAKRVVIAGNSGMARKIPLVNGVGENSAVSIRRLAESSVMSTAIKILPRCATLDLCFSSLNIRTKLENNIFNNCITVIPGKHYNKGTDNVYLSGSFSDNARVAEANSVVDLIVKKAEECKKQNRELSMAVYAFTNEGARLIESALNKRIGKDKELYNFIFKESPKPLIIRSIYAYTPSKRDEIIISLSMSENENGLPYAIFSTLSNKVVGKLLLSAISVAERNITVVSFINSSVLKNIRTTLPFYNSIYDKLSFICGYNAVNNQKSGISTKGNAIINSISKRLEENGYRLIYKLGQSSNLIDIGVCDKSARKLIAGILTDRSITKFGTDARFRENLLMNVPKGSIPVLTVHSADWLENSEKEINRIMSELSSL